MPLISQFYGILIYIFLFIKKKFRNRHVRGADTVFNLVYGLPPIGFTTGSLRNLLEKHEKICRV